MDKECQYSFSDLFEAAHGRRPSEEEYGRLMRVDQQARNKLVRAMTRLAGWHCDEREGTDGVTYVAFWPPDA